MLYTVVSAALLGFAPPQTNVAVRAPAAASSAVRMQFDMPKMPKIGKFEGLGGIEVEAFGDKFAKAGDLKLIPSDIQFNDKDGDTITLRGRGSGRVDYYVGKELKLENAMLTSSGTSLRVTGSVKKGT